MGDDGKVTDSTDSTDPIASPDGNQTGSRLTRTLRKRPIGFISIILVVFLVALAATLHEKSHSATPEKTTDKLPTSGLSVSQAGMNNLNVSAWLTYWDNGSGAASFKKNTAKFSSLHLFWYEARSATDIHQQAKLPAATIATAHKAGTPIIATVTETMKPTQFLTLVNDDTQRTAHVQALCSLVTSNSFAGIDLDYENLALGATPDQVGKLATGYAQLVGQLADCLHPKHKQVEVTVNARTSDSLFTPDQSLASGAYDYKALGKVADAIHIMAYDWHSPGSDAGSVDPLPWVNDVLNYALQNVPPRKIELGIPLYGYDWTEGKSGANPVTASQVDSVISKWSGHPAIDPESRSMWFDYAKDDVLHHVWYEDTAGTNLRIALAHERGIGGVIFWALGDENATLWQ